MRRVADAGTAIDPDVVSRLLGRRRALDPVNELTPRERAVPALIAEGRSNANIASELVVTVGAVEKHAANIFRKLRLPQADAGGHLAVVAWLQGRSDST